MGRKKGSKNSDFQETKDLLVERVARLATPASSFRELAAQAKVTPATLRHYFGDRQQVLHEVLVHQRIQGEPYLKMAATADMGDVRESLLWLLKAIAGAWSTGLGAVHMMGLSAGLGDVRVGPSYVNEVLEPTLQSVEARIQKHVDAGELRQTNIRHAALSLLSPVVLGLLHQDGLFGSKCRPLDMNLYIEDHVEHFVNAYASALPSK